MKRILIILCASILCGCVTGKHDYQQPSSYSGIQKSIIIDKSKDEVWKKMAANIGNSSFVVHNTNKDSGFINVSYSGDPCRYVDCGWITSTVSHAAGKREYSFPACQQQIQYEDTDKGYLFIINRKMDLEGRINIKIQEKSKNETRLTVNVRYVVTKAVSNQVIGTNRAEKRIDKINFNSGGSATFSHNPIICRCNGKLEKEIFSMAE